MKRQNLPLKKEDKIKTRTQRGYKPLEELIQTPKYKQAKESYKTNVGKRLSALYNYYSHLIDGHIANISRNRNLNHEDRRNLNSTLENMKMGIRYALKNGYVDEEYYSCVKEKLREIALFLRRLQSEKYHMGKYIREYGFDDVFAPENKYIEGNSLKIVESIQSFDEYILSCMK